MKAVLVGEAFGTREEMFRHPFVGSSGRELVRMISQAGLAPPLELRCRCGQVVPFGNCPHCGHGVWPSEMDMIAYWNRLRALGIAVTNAFQEHPPDNNYEAVFFTNAAEGVKDLPALKVKSRNLYLKPSAMHHIVRLWSELEDLRPNLVIALGNVASWAVLGRSKISEIRGTVTMSQRLKLKVLPTYHPSGVMQQPENRPITVGDFTKAIRECEFPEIRRPERWITVDPTFQEIEDWFRVPAEYYAVDIESGRALFTDVEMKHMLPAHVKTLNEQISMVGFARDRKHSLVIPFMTRSTDDMCYWPSFNDEIRAWRIVQRVLASPVPKIFQNGLYDISRLLAYRIQPKVCREDTMLLHHSMYPEMRKGLSFLGSIYSDEIAWKQMYAGGENLKRDS